MKKNTHFFKVKAQSPFMNVLNYRVLQLKIKKAFINNKYTYLYINKVTVTCNQSIGYRIYTLTLAYLGLLGRCSVCLDSFGYIQVFTPSVYARQPE
jgi:hypothetical protein